ncbi:MAG: hypothetical protein KIS67_26275 [Verrucomicrobiae bacterium]|nr:hypothetical protein [Verrucomicrobiae bacterium]
MPSHPAGEPSPDPLSTLLPSSGALLPARVPLDLHGQRVYVEWDPHAPVTPLGQLVYFSQFLATAGLFGEGWPTVRSTTPSPNAPSGLMCWARFSPFWRATGVMPT